MPKLDTDKLSAIRKVIKSKGLEAFILTDYNDIKYIMGPVFQPEEAVMLIHPKGVYVTARALYEAPVAADFPEIKIEGCDKDRDLKAVAAVKKLKLKKVGFDAMRETYHSGKIYIEAGFTPEDNFMVPIRCVKTEDELKKMRAAAKIAYKTYEHMATWFEPGVTEKQAAEELDSFMKANGAEGCSFDTIVAFGANTGNPHYCTGNAKLKKNMPVLLDFGCIYKGYCSDITRTFWFGDKPSLEFLEIFNIVKSAHDEVVEKAVLGQSGAEIDAISRSYIEAAGYGKYFTHRTGHGIGMQIHEEGCISQDNDNPILENYCFSVEPGIYLTGKLGVRYEDCFYMTAKGIKQIK